MERIKVESVSYSYQNKYQTVEAVRDVTCSFETGRLYVITGESDRDAYRREKVAVIYQAFHLFPLLTALENVMYPLEIRGMPGKEARRQAEACLEEAGVSRKLFGQYPKMMSGGEQQRTAVARAIASGGKILLADEPTGSLDSENEEKIVDLLLSLAHERDYTVIMVTHNREIAERADVRLVMKDGRMTMEQ